MTVRSEAYYSIASRRLQPRENLMCSQPKQVALIRAGEG
jgi:hypothetical protein